MKKLIGFFIVSMLLAITISAHAEENRYIVSYKNPAVLAENDSDAPFDVVDEETLNKLIDEDALEWYEEDMEAELFETEDISPLAYTYDTDKWELNFVGASSAYKLNSDGQGITIGIIDSGIAPHEALSDRIIGGRNYIDNNDNYTDTYGHGTMVAGMAAGASSENGFMGIAPKAKLAALKCFSEKSSSASYIARAIYGAVNDFHCDIINMSFGLKTESAAIKKAIEYAAENGVIMTAAAGNYGETYPIYPAYYDSVICVGSVNSSGIIASTSQHNSSTWIAAPGVSIKSTNMNGGFSKNSGTSFASPMAAGTAAVLKSMDNTLTIDDIKEILADSAVDAGADGYDEYYGYGILNISNCVENVLKDRGIYISPFDEIDENMYAIVYNNTDMAVNSTVLSAEFEGGRFSGIKHFEFEAEPKASIVFGTETKNEENEKKYFIWEENNIKPLSNIR